MQPWLAKETSFKNIIIYFFYWAQTFEQYSVCV